MATVESHSSRPNGVNGKEKGEGGRALSKNAKRRQKKKEQKAAEGENDGHVEERPSDHDAQLSAPSTLDLTSITLEEDASGTLAEFANVFSRFQAGPSAEGGKRGEEDGLGEGKGEVIYSDDDQLSEEEEEREAEKRISKRKQKQLRRLTVAELKQMVKKPELVDWEDVTATDPQLLIQLKSTRNTIPVPPHWNLKREYLQNKKGIEKPPFQLPSYIAATGIAEMKDALKEKEAEQTLKAKTRERVQPKMGKVVIDYQKLHDAFFRFQTKPESLTRFGEVYYEGKEFETKFKERKPGELSNELKEALSIPPLAPPPWLIAMQRFGPPPSYPQLRIPGLNAPIPEGAQWGFHPGGWGRPPMDEYGNPLFGDVMGQADSQKRQNELEAFEEAVEREPFGEFEPEEEAEESHEESEDDDDDEANDGEGQEEANGHHRPGYETPIDGLQTPSGLETPGGFQSVASTVPGGLETPGFIELRKGGRTNAPIPSSREEQGDAGAAKNLYQVLPEREMQANGRGFLSGDHGYDFSHMTSGNGQAPPAVLGADDLMRGTKRKAAAQGEVEVSLDVSELEGMSDAQLAERYAEARQVADPGPGSGGGEGADLALLREELQRKRSAKEARRANGR